MSRPASAPDSRSEPETLEELRGDCRRIDASWRALSPNPISLPVPTGSTAPAVSVPDSGTSLVAGFSVYGD